MANGSALVLIDLQVANFYDEAPIHRGDQLLATAGRLLEGAREAGVPVIFVQHEGGKGSWDEPGAPGFEIHPSIRPRDGEVIVRKATPDAFHETELRAELERIGARQLVIAGIQTEFCIDTSCRRAFSLGYDVTLVSDGHSCWDTDNLTADQIIAHHNATLGGWFVDLATADEVQWGG